MNFRSACSINRPVSGEHGIVTESSGGRFARERASCTGIIFGWNVRRFSGSTWQNPLAGADILAYVLEHSETTNLFVDQQHHELAQQTLSQLADKPQLIPLQADNSKLIQS